MATPTLQNYIDGRWLDASGGGTFENTNPATGELIANVAKSTVAQPVSKRPGPIYERVADAYGTVRLAV